MSAAAAPLLGRHAVVTGGGSGIGAAIAASLAGAGASVTVMGRRFDAVAAVAKGLPHARAVACDVTDEASVAQAFAAAADLHGPVAILVNNAGSGESAPLHKTDRALWDRMLAVNLTGPFLCARAVLPAMVASGWGRIVTVASTAGLKGYAYVSAYVAAKHGVVGLTRALALETAPAGVTVNAVCPGYTETDMVEAALSTIERRTGRTRDQARAELVKGNPQGRFVQPEEVAEAVLWLCRPESAAVTGTALPIAGGEVG